VNCCLRMKIVRDAAEQKNANRNAPRGPRHRSKG